MQINAVIRLKLCYKTDSIQYYQIKKKRQKIRTTQHIRPMAINITMDF